MCCPLSRLKFCDSSFLVTQMYQKVDYYYFFLVNIFIISLTFCQLLAKQFEVLCVVEIKRVSGLFQLYLKTVSGTICLLKKNLTCSKNCHYYVDNKILFPYRHFYVLQSQPEMTLFSPVIFLKKLMLYVTKKKKKRIAKLFFLSLKLQV